MPCLGWLLSRGQGDCSHRTFWWRTSFPSCSICRVQVTAKLDFKRKRERKGPWSPTELPTSCDILLFAPCPRQNFHIKRQETILIISNFWSTERQRYSKTCIYNIHAFYLRFLGGNSINSTKYTWLDFSSFFGLDFSAMPVYLCVKIMLNNEFKSSQWQPLPLFFKPWNR